MKFYVRLWTMMGQDPKIQCLKDKEYRIWVEALQFAGREDKEGRIGTTKEISQSLPLHLDVSLTQKILISLSELELLTKKKDIWWINNWKKYQSKPSDSPEQWAERKRKQREKKKMARDVEEGKVTPPSHADGGGTNGVSRGCPAGEDSKGKDSSSLKPITTTAEPETSPVDKFSDPAIVSTLIRLCGLNADTPADLQRCRVIDEALGDNHPDINPDQLSALYGPNGWWHKKHYPELAIPMPPSPEEVLETLAQALVETGQGEPA